MDLYEAGRLIAHPASIKAAKKMIAGLDLSMATVDADPQEYELKDESGKTVYYRKRTRIP